MNSMRMNIEENDSRGGRGRFDRGPGPRPGFGPERGFGPGHGFGPERGERGEGSGVGRGGRGRPGGRRGRGGGRGADGAGRPAFLMSLGERPTHGREHGREPRHQRPEHQALREGVGQIAIAARQVAAIGTPEQKDRAAQALTDARRALYQLLADSE